MAGGDHLSQDGDGVSYGSSIYTAVQIAIRTCYFHFNIAESANASVYGGILHTQHGSIADENHIGLELLPVCGEKLSEVG